MVASADVTVEIANHVADVEIHRPPNNFFDVQLIAALADAFEELDASGAARAIVLRAEGRHFCAGAQLAGRASGGSGPEAVAGDHLYDHAARLFACRTPVVAAVQGAAVGGGLGLALMADFRVASPEARFSANFARLGFHHGFALSVTLPRVVGNQRASELLYTGRRLTGEEALAIGLCDRLVAADELVAAAQDMAGEIAASAPLAVASIRATLRGELAAAATAAMAHERAEQDRLARTADFAEGVRAMQERRPPEFTAR